MKSHFFCPFCRSADTELVDEGENGILLISCNKCHKVSDVMPKYEEDDDE